MTPAKIERACAQCGTLFVAYVSRRQIFCSPACSKAGQKTALKDMTGQRFGRLVVMERSAKTRRAAQWLCRCDCGKSAVSNGDNLRRGLAKSCGCISTERLVKATRRHGLTGTRTHRIWTSMLTRVTNPRRRNAHRYIGRNIQVCDRWKTFDNFLADMGEAPTGMSLDRYPNQDGNYEPGNCRWATYTQQARNTSVTRMVTVNGERIALRDACDSFGISVSTVSCRIRAGWPESRWLEPSRRPAE